MYMNYDHCLHGQKERNSGDFLTFRGFRHYVHTRKFLFDFSVLFLDSVLHLVNFEWKHEYLPCAENKKNLLQYYHWA